MCLQMYCRSKRQRAMSETVTAQGPDQSHPSPSTPQRQGTNTALPHPLFETIDLTSVPLSHSPQTEHEHIYGTFEDTDVEADTVQWDPEDDLGDEENVVISWHHVDSEDVTQVM